MSKDKEKFLPIEFKNVLRLHNGNERNFFTVNENEVTIKNAVLISMVYQPEGIREKIIWKLFKDLLMKDHYENFEKAEKDNETIS